MKTFHKLAIITGLLIGLSAGTPSQATTVIADRPLPSLPGVTSPTKHVFSVNPVISFNGVTTSFHCTSSEKTGGKDIVWGVEMFLNDNLVNDVTAGEGVMTLFPGQTGVISIHNSRTFVENADLPGVVLDNRSSARILANSNKLTCTALMLNPDNDPSHFITSLPVIKKMSQKGQ